ncbi:alpha-hydroxy-acid oxidizing protein [uncultured Cetobacterium sp.]|uniref:alpha-hydroxy-acid oxidizing protein n=1 Tax=uncultured Cetobacterium sp. TaxID=527638 RepID=UPI00263105E4|nr:alpha-hydroxy-acid oxidizing protein [uncultured Cetobacterium sp.]
MDIKEIKKNAKERMKEFCILCPECNGRWCAGKVPGMGGAVSGGSFQRAFEKLKEIKIAMRTLHNVTNPNLECNLFGEKLSAPILIAPITGTKFNMGGYITDEQYSNDTVLGAIDAGTISMIGDTGDPNCFQVGIDAIKKANGKGIAIIKPRENSEIIKRIKIAEEAGAIAVGVDIDGAGLITMKLFGQPVGPKSLDDLKTIISSTKLPFIVKGILTVDEARLCVEAGADAIVVSNHGGRCLNETFAPAEVLKDIAEAVGKDIKILADGAVREGIDVLKYLALGADAVLIGRPIIWGSVGGRQEGVKVILETLKSQLYQGMILSGADDVKHSKNFSRILVTK